MIDRVVKINHVNETYIHHIEDDISFIGFHFYQKVKNNNVRSFEENEWEKPIWSSRSLGRPSAWIDLNQVRPMIGRPTPT